VPHVGGMPLDPGYHLHRPEYLLRRGPHRVDRRGVYNHRRPRGHLRRNLDLGHKLPPRRDGRVVLDVGLAGAALQICWTPAMTGGRHVTASRRACRRVHANAADARRREETEVAAVCISGRGVCRAVRSASRARCTVPRHGRTGRASRRARACPDEHDKEHAATSEKSHDRSMINASDVPMGARFPLRRPRTGHYLRRDSRLHSTGRTHPRFRCRTS
jgi:hypothetical protein